MDIREDFETQLNYFIRKARKYIRDWDATMRTYGVKPEKWTIDLTRDDAKEIRTYMRKRYKEIMEKQNEVSTHRC